MRTIIERRTKAERRAERQGRRLRGSVIQPATEKRYDLALGVFFDWLEVEGRGVPRFAAALDAAVAECIEALWDGGESKGLAGDLLSAVTLHIPPAKGKLPMGWRLLKAWQRMELPAQAPPFDELAIGGLVGHLAAVQGDVAMAACLAVAFHCFLRTGEALGLQCQHVVTDGSSGAVMLPSTKKGIRDCVSITDAAVAQLALLRVQQAAPGDSFVGCSAALARTKLERALGQLGLGGVGFRWYSCRRGGATCAFRSHGQMEKVLVRGPWESGRTARIYLTDGIGQLVHLRLAEATKQKLLRLARAWVF